MTSHGAAGGGATKSCSRCVAVKPVTAFFVNNRNDDGRESICKQCIKGDVADRMRKAERARKEETARNPEGVASRSKTCSECRSVKRLIDYRRDKYCSDGHTSKCKACEKKKRADRVYTDDGTKLCRQCKRTLPLATFHVDKSRSDGRRNVCRQCGVDRPKVIPRDKECPECHAVKDAAHFHASATMHDGLSRLCKSCANAAMRKYRDERKAYLLAAKRAAGGCEDKCGRVFCDEELEYCLEFAHYDRKQKARSKSTGKPVSICNLSSINLIQAELPKGRFCCWICHAKETEEERRRDRSENKSAVDAHRLRAPRVAFVNDRKRKIGECALCHISVDGIPLPAFNFDHIDPLTKSYDLARMVVTSSLSDIRTELAKCQLVCTPCHRRKTAHDFATNPDIRAGRVRKWRATREARRSNGPLADNGPLLDLAVTIPVHRAEGPGSAPGVMRATTVLDAAVAIVNSGGGSAQKTTYSADCVADAFLESPSPKRRRVNDTT
jgi:hypothetical protein